MKRIYLSGPMSGLPGLNFPNFHSMTASLRASGHTVTNPAEINPEGGTWTDCIRRDIAALMDCYTVATLPGWENSKGARLEVHIARELGVPIVNAHDLALISLYDSTIFN
ncbi:DUF4406 domain-containing protein [Pseudomonas sp. HN8-3]|uniref:DUF4406 domain-containing protein n=1 Tax=Pseudomonas sp. HN8-3 TaxID=2886361 RepID=UPI001E3E5108|nr:DUF4406 domain-containing protein [Pseudomonas sp. HN8-3]UEH06348.1 DUF4406 domain-containing protein [Pseudomonas sp. HN8-3]